MPNGSIFEFNFVSLGATGFGATNCCSLLLEGVVDGETEAGLTFDPQANGPRTSFESNITFAALPGPELGVEPRPVPLPAGGLFGLTALMAPAPAARRRA
jgi:hypothetical protein